MNWIDNLWYSPKWCHWPVRIILLPFTLLFWGLSAFRRLLFRVNIKVSENIAVPVIVVGNISVGGNGKTPLVIYLAGRLKKEGYHPGILSRGYGGKNAQYPMLVDANSTADVAGDEPVLMKQHVNCPLVVDPIRTRGAKELVDKYQCDVIICDDGLQHYQLQRDMEIVVMDGKRLTGNKMLLPAGPLREGLWRLDTVDFVVLNGGVVTNGEYLMSLEAGRLVNIKYPNKSMSITEVKQAVVAAAGIGNPQRFFDLLNQKGITVKKALNFADHHQFSQQDLPNEMVIMTEKDAVKCTSFAYDDWWYLPVRAALTQQFETQLLQRVKQLTIDKKKQ